MPLRFCFYFMFCFGSSAPHLRHFGLRGTGRVAEGQVCCEISIRRFGTTVGAHSVDTIWASYLCVVLLYCVVLYTLLSLSPSLTLSPSPPLTLSPSPPLPLSPSPPLSPSLPLPLSLSLLSLLSLTLSHSLTLSQDTVARETLRTVQLFCSVGSRRLTVSLCPVLPAVVLGRAHLVPCEHCEVSLARWRTTRACRSAGCAWS